LVPSSAEGAELTSQRNFHDENEYPRIGYGRAVSTICFILGWIVGVLGLIGSIVAAASSVSRTGAGAFFIFVWSLGGTLVLVTILMALGFILRIVIATHEQRHRADMARSASDTPPRVPSPASTSPSRTPSPTATTWAGHASTPMPRSAGPAHNAPICPNCEVPMVTEPTWSMWKCESCNAPLCAVECTACHRAYITVWTNWTSCRRCHADWVENVHTITLDELRAKGNAQAGL
jgi:hypothetical protein